MSILSSSESNIIISMLKNPNEDFQKVIGLIEEKLKQSEEKYRTIIEGFTQTEIGVDIIDLNHNIIYQNDFLRGRFGYHNGRKCYEHYLGRENSCKICPMEKAINTNKVEKETIITPENRIYEITSAPLLGKDGKVDRAAEVIIDITERRQAEADLKRGKLFIEEAFNAQRDTFFVFEPSSGKAIRWNKAFREISGYSDEEILAMRAPDSYYDEKSLQRAAEATLLVEEKSASYIKMDLITKNGNSIPFEYIGSSITDEEGNLKYIVSIGRNITERLKMEQELKESEEKYRELFQNMSSGVAVYEVYNNGEDFVFKDYNLSSEKMDNINKENIIGKKVTDVFPSVKEFGLFDVFQRVWRTGEPEHHPISLYEDDRIKGWRENYVYKLPTGEIVVVYDDVTVRTKAELSLRESEKKYRQLVNNVNSIIMRLDKDANILFINKYGEKFFGYKEEELIGKNVIGTIVPKTESSGRDLRQMVDEVFKNPERFKTNENENITKSGRRLWISWENSAIMDEKDKLIGILTVGNDITERKKAEEELNKFKEISDNANYGIGILDPDGTLTYVNNYFANIHGYKPDEIIGKSFTLLHNDDQINRILELKQKLEVEGSYSAEEVWHLHKDGSIFPTLMNGVSIKDDNGNVLFMAATLIDISVQYEAEEKLKDSEKKYRLLFDKSPIGINLFTMDRKLIDSNNAMEKITGYSIEEFKNLEAGSIYADPNDRVKLKKLLQEFGKVRDYETKLKKKNNIEFFSSINLDLIELYGQKIIQTSLRDITDQKKAEQKLRESEEKYRSLFENSPVALMDQDYSEMKKYIDHLKATGIKDFKKYFEDYPKEVLKFLAKVKVIDVNRKTLEVYKFDTKEDFISRMNKLSEELENKMTEEILLDNKKEILALINGDTIYESEISSTTSLGDIMHLYAKTSIASGFESTWSNVIVSILDITDQKNVEKNLRESEEKYRNLIETSSMGLLEIDNIHKSLKYINPRLLEIFEYNEDEFLKYDKFDKFIHPNDLKEVLDYSQERKLEFRIFSKSGKTKWLSGNRLHYYDEKGNLIYVRFWLQDISEKKELEKIKTNLITRFSHEFKTPLISIRGFTELLMIKYKDNQDEKLNTILVRIIEGAERLKSLIDSFIETSYIDEKLVEINFSRVNISKLVRIILNEMEGIIILRNHEITVNLQEDLVATADNEKIRLIISNLIMNAINYTPVGGKISINSIIKKDFITFSIKDNGVGLNEEEKSKLFKPFGKIERYGQGWDVVSDGMGMGLYITKGLVELHKGTIWVESAGRNKGSIFTVKIPIKQ